mmetsp:Transcript_22317/g.27291  ORF Transcript_22317/g.27291 Transcript_22317/m.27291 type:complete len:305 (+) Transcript_22317:111-1025(+)
MSLSRKEEQFFCPTDLQHEESSTHWQRIRTAGCLMPLYYVAFYRVGKPLLRKLLSRHPNWEALGQRSGTFHKNGQEEVLYVTLTGIHHGTVALLFKLAYEKKKAATEDKSNGEADTWTHRSTQTWAGVWELAFEWVDWICLLTKLWPFEDPDPRFVVLVGIHHLVNFCMWPTWSLNTGYTKRCYKLYWLLMASSALSFFVNTYQQLLNLNTKKGLRAAFAIQLANIIAFGYTRVYLWFKDGLAINHALVKENETRTDVDDATKSQYRIRIRAGFVLLSVFNLTAALASAGNCAKYLAALQEVKS